VFIAYTIVAIILAVGLVGSARAKLVHDAKVTKSLTGIGVPESWFPFLSACEIAGAVGLLAGIWLAPLGVAAAIGVILYFIGAVTAHLRVRDAGWPLPAAIGLLAVAALLLRLAA
jgi:hypothetical protein